MKNANGKGAPGKLGNAIKKDLGKLPRTPASRQNRRGSAPDGNGPLSSSTSNRPLRSSTDVPVNNILRQKPPVNNLPRNESFNTTRPIDGSFSNNGVPGNNLHNSGSFGNNGRPRNNTYHNGSSNNNNPFGNKPYGLDPHRNTFTSNSPGNGNINSEIPVRSNDGNGIDSIYSLEVPGRFSNRVSKPIIQSPFFNTALLFLSLAEASIPHHHCLSDPGHVFGHSGPSHGDMAHQPGPPMSHHNGAPTHNGDSGMTNPLFTNDVLHHGDGGVFVNSGGQAIPPDAMNVDDIHHRMNDALDDATNARIAGLEADRKAEELKRDIARERDKQKQDELRRLKDLDDAAIRNEHSRPEVLGKRTIPVAAFTQESFPLFHHVRDLLQKIKGIQLSELRAIEAQKQIARLDDITDKVNLQQFAVTKPHSYNEFIDLGGTRKFFYVPVRNDGGRFYIGPSSGLHNFGTHDIPLKTHMFPDGHSHFIDHGNKTDSDLEHGGASVGPGPRRAFPGGLMGVPGGPIIPEVASLPAARRFGPPPASPADAPPADSLGVPGIEPVV